MANNPIFPFYVNDFEGGTRHMTDAEVGCYLRLLMAQFNRGGQLPLDEKLLSRYCTSFNDSWPIVSEKFQKINGSKIQNKRLEQERIKRENFVDSRSKNKKGKTKSHENHMKITSETSENHLGKGKGNGNGDGDSFGMSENLLTPQMVRIFKDEYPSYPSDQEHDFPACYEIASKIAKSKGWAKSEITNGKLNETLDAWKEIVLFSKTDQWFSTRSISDFNKEYQRLIQKITNGGTTNRQSVATDKQPRPNTSDSKVNAVSKW